MTIIVTIDTSWIDTLKLCAMQLSADELADDIESKRGHYASYYFT